MYICLSLIFSHKKMYYLDNLWQFISLMGQWRRSGSTWQSSRHVTDGRQARASAGGEGGGGVD